MTVSPIVAPRLTCCDADALAEETVWTSSGRQHMRCYELYAVGMGWARLDPEDPTHHHVWSLGTGTRFHTCPCGAHRCARRACSAVMLPKKDGLCVYHAELAARCRLTAEARELIGAAPGSATLGSGGRPRWGRAR